MRQGHSQVRIKAAYKPPFKLSESSPVTGLYSRIVRRDSDVSEEYIASISRVQRRQAEHAHGVTTQEALFCTQTIHL
jgi:hypothetical protein